MAAGISRVLLLMLLGVFGYKGGVLMVEGYSSGAPTSACPSMIPGHYVNAQSSASPYTVSTSATTVEPGSAITVTVGGSAFKGLMLQARAPGESTPRGTWTVPANSNTRQVECSAGQNAVTHNTALSATSLQFTWTAPSSGLSQVDFYATVVQSKNVFWVKVKSASTVSIQAAQTSPAPAITTQAPGGQTQASTTASGGNGQTTPATTPSAGVTPTSAAARHLVSTLLQLVTALACIALVKYVR